MNKQNKLLDNELAEFLGWHIGDGCISITNRYHEYALTGDLSEEHSFYSNSILPAINRLFHNQLTKEVKLKEYKSNGVCGIYLFDKDFVQFLQKNFGLINGKKINVKIPDIIQTKEQKISFLRGLFDTDGSIYYCKSNYKPVKESLYNIFHYKPKIKLATISKDLIDEVYRLLCDLGYHPRLRKPAKQRARENIMYGVVLHRNQDTKRWIHEIRFRNPKHWSKVQLSKKFGFCPPHTTLKQRTDMLNRKLNPLDFYQSHKHLSLKSIKNTLT